MTQTNGGQVTLRLAVAGQDVVKAALRELGPEGAKAMRQIEQAGRQANTSLMVIDSTAREVKGAVMGVADSSGAAGRVLGALGPIGIAAAAGIGALTLALHKTRESLDFVDNLGDTATKLRVSVEALQEWRFAAVEANLEAGDFDASIQGLQSSVGKFVSGLGGARVAKAFEALGISREQAASFKSVSDMLPLLADRLKDVGSEAEKVAIADKLGVRQLLPLLEQGSEKIADMTKRFRDLGIILDSKTVASMGEMQRKAELASQAIDVNLKQAFLNLAPTLVMITNLMAELTKTISITFGGFKKIEDRSLSQIDGRLKQLRLVENVGPEFARKERKAEIAKLEDQRIRLGAYNSDLQGRYDPIRDPETGKMVTPNQRGQVAAGIAAWKLTTHPFTGEGVDGPIAAAARLGRQSARSAKVSRPALPWNADTSSPMVVDSSTIVDLAEQRLKAIDWSRVLEPISTASRDNLIKGFSDAQGQTYSALREAVSGGLQAGFDGGGKGALKFFVDRMRNQVFEGLVDSITQAMMTKAASGAAGSGLFGSGLFGGLLSSVFGGLGTSLIPARASGGMAFGTTLVGERGPELVNFTQPGMVYSAERTRLMLQGLGQGGGGGGAGGRAAPVVHIDNRKIINAAGADPAALARVSDRLDDMQKGEAARWVANAQAYGRATR